MRPVRESGTVGDSGADAVSEVAEQEAGGGIARAGALQPSGGLALQPSGDSEAQDASAGARSAAGEPDARSRPPPRGPRRRRASSSRAGSSWCCCRSRCSRLWALAKAAGKVLLIFIVAASSR